MPSWSGDGGSAVTAGLPLVVGVSAANTHDSEALKPMVEGHQTRHDPHRGRHFKPQRLHADKAYDIPHLRKWLRGKRIGVRIARKGLESSETTWPFSAWPPLCAATSD